MKITLSYTPFGTNTSCEVMFCHEINDVLPPKRLKKFHRGLFVYDSSLRMSLIQKVIATFQEAIPQIVISGFIYGPKSLQNLQKIWKQMVISVPDLIIGMGGGTITDLVGFAASTYQRGIPHVLVPTTALSMIDASLGGKTAIDFGGIKNSIGAVHYPLIVINIMKALETLPQDEFFSGLSEAVKAAILFDAGFFHELEMYAKEKNYSFNNHRLLKIMTHSSLLKMKNSEMPPAHKIKLLYGHAVGQGIELMGKQRIRHGDAVAMGMTIEGALACLLGIWKEQEWASQTTLLKELNLPIVSRFYKSDDFVDKLLEKMSLYKKLITPNSFGFILPKKIGGVVGDGRKFLTYIDRSRMKNLLCQSLRFVKNKGL